MKIFGTRGWPPIVLVEQRTINSVHLLIASAVVVIVSIQPVAARGHETGGSESIVKIDAARHRGPMLWTPVGDPSKFEEELKQQGYINLRGASIHNPSADIRGEKKFDVDAMVWTQGILAGRKIRKVWFAYVTVLDRDSNGRPTNRLENAYEYELIGKEEALEGTDNGCISRTYPKHQIVAIGEWKWRKDPRLGGYAKSIKYAWVADPEQKKLRPIPPDTVICEIRDDRD